MAEALTRRRRFTDNEVKAGLRALALHSGNVKRTSRTIGIHENTLRDWRKRHMDLYKRTCEEVVPELNAQLAQADDDLVQAAHALERESMDKLREKIPNATANELTQIYGKAAINAGIHTDKANIRRGMPTEIKQTINVNDALAKLKRIAPTLVIDSTAKEEALPSARVLEEPEP